MDQARYLYVFADNLEQAPGLDGRPVRIDAEAWYGGYYNRLWMKLEGSVGTQLGERDVEVQALFSRLIAPFWDAQLGVRMDAAWGDGAQQRGHLVLGLQGLAPYWFEVETAVFLSTDGGVSASAQAAYDLLFTQRLILESELEVAASLQDRPAWGESAGITGGELGFRLRYEFKRELAPYVGYVRTARFGDQTDLAGQQGRSRYLGSMVAGVRMWY
jgi:copper resistance protein B